MTYINTYMEEASAIVYVINSTMPKLNDAF
jgi:hypothetical protein